MPNYKSRSDTEAWWSSQPGNRGKTYPGDDIAEKQYERRKAAGENNASIARNFFGRLFGKDKPDPVVDLGKTNNYALDKSGSVDLTENSAEPTTAPIRHSLDFESKPIASQKRGGKIKKHADGGKISLDNCKVSTHQKSKKHPNW